MIVFSDSSLVTYQFLELGDYTVWVNVSNTITSSTRDYAVKIIERINNVTLVKLDLPANAVATNEEARINVSSLRNRLNIWN